MKIDKKMIIMIVEIILGVLIVGTLIFFIFNKEEILQRRFERIEPTGKIIVSEVKELSEDEYSTNLKDESVILVNNSAKVKISNTNINKSGDTQNEVDNYSSGTNSAIVVKDSAEADIYAANVETQATSGNAIFTIGEKTKITMTDSTLITKRNNSNGIVASEGANVEAKNVIISTLEEKSSALYAYENSNIQIEEGTLNTNQKDSPCIYAKGNVTVINSSGNANNSTIAQIENNGKVQIDSSDITAMGLGRTSNEIYDCGIFISETKDEETAGLDIKNSNISIIEDSSSYAEVPMLLAHDAKVNINLENTILKFGSNKLVVGIKSNINLGIKDMNLKGDILLDNESGITVDLQNSVFEGNINEANNAKEVNVKLDRDSLWIVDRTCYVSSIVDDNEDFGNIQSNGNTIFYDSSNPANEKLNGRIIALIDGGMLKPME